MYRPTNRIHMVYISNIIYVGNISTGLGLFWNDFPHTQHIPSRTEWDLDPSTHFHGKLGFLEKKISLQNIVEIRGMYSAHCYFTVGWAGRNDIPDNRQDFLSCKHFVEWPALLSMKYRGSTGYSLNINKPARTRPQPGLPEGVPNSWNSQCLQLAKCTNLVPLDLLLICILRSAIGTGTTSNFCY